MRFKMKKNRLIKKINSKITRKEIELHIQGYTLDFCQLPNERSLLCLQDNMLFPMAGLTITLMDQSYDSLQKSFIYIHTIDSDCGYKGLLIANKICFLNSEEIENNDLKY